MTNIIWWWWWWWYLLLCGMAAFGLNTIGFFHRINNKDRSTLSFLPHSHSHFHVYVCFCFEKITKCGYNGVVVKENEMREKETVRESEKERKRWGTNRNLKKQK